MPQIEVKFDIDQNGILNVGARDLGTQKEATIRIEQSAGLSDTEIERMRHDAESHAEEDRRQFELVEARNQADQMCYQLEKLMRENADKLGENDRAPLEKAVQKTREVAKGSDTQAIRSAISELEQASQAFSKTLYERAQAGAQPDQAGSQTKGQAGSGGDDDAIDAEFEVKD